MLWIGLMIIGFGVILSECARGAGPDPVNWHLRNTRNAMLGPYYDQSLWTGRERHPWFIDRTTRDLPPEALDHKAG